MMMESSKMPMDTFEQCILEAIKLSEALNFKMRYDWFCENILKMSKDEIDKAWCEQYGKEGNG